MQDNICEVPVNLVYDNYFPYIIEFMFNEARPIISLTADDVYKIKVDY